MSDHAKEATSITTHWVILIGGGYGAFLHEGAEAEAEEMRSHKSRWERAVGKKRPATDAEIKCGIASDCWNHPGFNNRMVYTDCDCPDDDCVADAMERRGSTP